MSYSVEQLPHCDLLRLILSTERFVLSARQLFNVGTDLRILYLTRGSIRCLQAPLCVRAGRSALGCLPKFQLSPRLHPVPTLGAPEFIQVRCAESGRAQAPLCVCLQCGGGIGGRAHTESGSALGPPKFQLSPRLNPAPSNFALGGRRFWESKTKGKSRERGTPDTSP